MTEPSEDDLRRLDELKAQEDFMARMQWYQEQGLGFRHFKANMYKFFRGNGLGASDTIEDGIQAVEEIIRQLVWRAAGWKKQEGWLNTLVAAAGGIAALVFAVVMLAKNWPAIVSMAAGS